ncbi:DNA repair protein RecN [Promicromonospora thailandica]|uniref:DNA repair protein RecN n=1 Tax=Promicromonospora thailandica TaxID=765201 RepID=A0A9X2G5G0_9MICO|nr:DNA repair protein RecN [Promicromonospora thailandica]MCP2267134.1 DNA repair protein RecN (Recombination protein N) [Promicromonospora thailandica]BFF17565.1 DNA repair protein RecN [Promicromonospora thailandica]
MLEEIAIENLGVIRSARVPLSDGLTVITGETGAGKTMVLTGLNLLMGAKADPQSVRPGAASAAVEGRVRVSGRDAVLERVDEAGGEVEDDGTVVILRTIADGRSRAHLGGRAVPQGVLAEIAEDLFTVHGQADQLRLRTAAKQRDALDTFVGPAHQRVLASYRAAWTERGGLLAEIADLEARGAERAREVELLRIGLEEIERVDPQSGEDAELQALIERLSNAEGLRTAATEAHEAVAGEDADGARENAIALVERARRALESAAHSDAALGALATRFAEVGYLLSDVATDVAAYVDDLQADPAGLETAHNRMAELNALTRSYGETIDEVLQWASDAGLRLLDLDDGGDRLTSMRARVAELDGELARLAEILTAERTRGATELAEAVTHELHGLAMGGAHLVVSVQPLEEPGPFGADQVTFLLVPHPGAPERPLGKGASGGELSRVMLALEVALATSGGAAAERTADTPRSTFVFDEVDAGVGGRAAVEVGRRLAQLGRSTQVVVVTHLAQVAAFADAHLVVTKSSDGDGGDAADDGMITVTGVREVTADARVRELARMLSGQDDSETARTHALELLESSVVGR